MQVSSVIVTVGGPLSVTVSAAEAEPPELVRVKVCDAVFPTATSPKSKPPLVDGDQSIDGVRGLPPAWPPTTTTSDAPAATAAASMIRTTLFRIVPPLTRQQFPQCIDGAMILPAPQTVKSPSAGHSSR